MHYDTFTSVHIPTCANLINAVCSRTCHQ